MDFFSIRITVHSVIAVAEHIRRGCPVRHPSPKKAPSVRIPIVASFPPFDTTLSLTFPIWIIEDGVTDIPLIKDSLPFGERRDCSTAVDGGKKGLGIELAALLGCGHGFHDWPLSMLKDAQEPQCSVQPHSTRGSPGQRKYFVGF